MKKDLIIIAHNIRSAYNVGAIFRTADGMGVGKLFLTGYSPAPDQGQFQTQAGKMIAKTALGAEKTLAWEKRSRLGPLLEKLKATHVQIVALEQDKRSVDYRKFKPQFPIVLILGNEPRGIDQKTLKYCDQIIEIPMRGAKNSLNVSVAFGIAGYEIMR